MKILQKTYQYRRDFVAPARLGRDVGGMEVWKIPEEV